MFTKSVENSNVVNNNPEAVNLGIAELVLKQWALDTIFSPEVKRAHDTGAIHLHDLGYPHRVYCSSHSVEYVKKYGLKGLLNLNTESSPAKSASVLTGHLNTFLASMQANYAGALGIAYINIFYAPLLEGKDAKYCIMSFSTVKMHHLSWIRTDIREKLKNWSAKKYFDDGELVEKVIERYENYEDGQNAFLLFNVPEYRVVVNKLSESYIHPKYPLV